MSTRKLQTQRGFTLVEMLVVITIIGILMALLIPVIAGAMGRAQQTRNGFEISQLIMAIESFKSARGGVYPPSFGEAQAAGTTYEAMFDAGTYRNTALYRYLITAYPNISDKDIRSMFRDIADHLDQSSSMVFWLSQTSEDPRNPFTNRASLKSYYAFPEERLADLGDTDADTTNNIVSFNVYGFRPPYAKESYYVYMEAKHYRYYTVNNVDSAQGNTSKANSGGLTLRPYLKSTRSDNLRITQANFQNSDTYQLLCAGIDGRFQANQDWLRVFPCGSTPLKGDNTPFTSVEFADDRDNQANFSDGNPLEDVQP
jgi:prepilin-type N-terminal cleavage/methylation domain-containing protein